MKFERFEKFFKAKYLSVYTDRYLAFLSLKPQLSGAFAILFLEIVQALALGILKNKICLKSALVYMEEVQNTIKFIPDYDQIPD